MRISDWSSDVCSSDLRLPCRGRALTHGQDRARRAPADAGTGAQDRCGARLQRRRTGRRDRVESSERLVQPQPRGLTVRTCSWPARRCSTSRSEEHTSELQSLMRISYAVFCLKKKKTKNTKSKTQRHQTH